MRALIRKEILAHFASPVFAVTAAVFLFLTGFAFSASVTQASPNHLPEASIRGIMYFMAVMLLFVSPFLTMKTLAEERKSGTLELLKTSPLTDLEIVIAKFLASLFLLAVLLGLTLEFPLFIALCGDPDPGAMVLCYAGLFLMGASYLAIGIFMSSLTKSQMVAAILSFATMLILWLVGDTAGGIGRHISLIEHIQSFSIGVLDTTDAAYYLLVTFVFLFLTYRVLEAERWR